VESGSEADADVAAVAAKSELVCVNLTMIRAGRHLGDKTFFPQNAEGMYRPRCCKPSSNSITRQTGTTPDPVKC